MGQCRCIKRDKEVIYGICNKCKDKIAKEYDKKRSNNER